LRTLVDKDPLHGTGMTRRPPGVASDFNASVTSDIIQSPCGQGTVEGKVQIGIAN